jgi:hypothetical protein
MNRLRGKRATTQPNRGTAPSMAIKVPLNSQGSARTPPAMPISSRKGRKMK